MQHCADSAETPSGCGLCGKRLSSAVRPLGKANAVFDELDALAFQYIGDALDGPGIAGRSLPTGALEADQRADMHLGQFSELALFQ
jgi:hypothetical protein